MPYVNIDTDVWVEPEEILSDLKDEDVVAELKRRGYNTDTLFKVATPEADAWKFGPLVPPINLLNLYELKRVNDPRFDQAFSDFLWNNIGRSL